MSLKLYFDVHVNDAITRGLRRRGVDVLRAQDNGAGELQDPKLLDRATELGRVLFTQDEDLLTEAARRQRGGEHFAGVIYGHQLRVTIGQCVADLELLAKLCDPEEMLHSVTHLPL